VYGKLRVWGRGFSEGKSEAGKRATNFVPAKTSNFLYTACHFVVFFLTVLVSSFSVLQLFEIRLSDKIRNILNSAHSSVFTNWLKIGLFIFFDY